MNWIVFLFALEMGICPDNMVLSNEVYPQPIYIQFETEIILLKNLHVCGTARVDVFKDKLDYGFCPVSLNSLMDVYFQKDLIRAGSRFVCIHPIIPYSIVSLPGQDYNKSYMQVYLRIGNKR